MLSSTRFHCRVRGVPRRRLDDAPRHLAAVGVLHRRLGPRSGRTSPGDGRVVRARSGARRSPSDCRWRFTAGPIVEPDSSVRRHGQVELPGHPVAIPDPAETGTEPVVVERMNTLPPSLSRSKSRLSSLLSSQLFGVARSGASIGQPAAESRHENHRRSPPATARHEKARAVAAWLGPGRMLRRRARGDDLTYLRR